MDRNKQTVVQVLIVAGVAGMILARLVDGKITWYINSRFVPLTVLAVILLAAMIISALRQGLRARHTHEHAHDHTHTDQKPAWELAMLAVPVLIGLAIPAQPLSSAAFDTRGLDLSIPAGVVGNQAGSTLPRSLDTYSLLDWFQAANQPERANALVGQTASVVGFVYHDQRLPGDHFMVGRFVVTCCVADSFPIGMAVAWPEATGLENDTWVRVSGPVTFIELDGINVPLIRAETVEAVGIPQQPYIFP